LARCGIRPTQNSKDVIGHGLIGGFLILEQVMTWLPKKKGDDLAKKKLSERQAFSDAKKP